MRAIAEAVGIGDILTKCLGTTNPHNVIRATFAALEQLTTPEQASQLRRGAGETELIEEVEPLRGPLPEVEV